MKLINIVIHCVFISLVSAGLALAIDQAPFVCRMFIIVMAIFIGIVYGLKIMFDKFEE